jgi:NAD(P)H-nitrite reductase large subunit
MPKLFIVGGSDAGISAALRAREIAPEWQVSVAVADRYPNFSICGIPYSLSREVREVDDLAHRNAADIQRLGIELLLNHRIETIDPNAHRIIALRPDGQVSEYGYDKLVCSSRRKSSKSVKERPRRSTNHAATMSTSRRATALSNASSADRSLRPLCS